MSGHHDSGRHRRAALSLRQREDLEAAITWVTVVVVAAVVAVTLAWVLWPAPEPCVVTLAEDGTIEWGQYTPTQDAWPPSCDLEWGAEQTADYSTPYGQDTP